MGIRGASRPRGRVSLRVSLVRQRAVYHVLGCLLLAGLCCSLAPDARAAGDMALNDGSYGPEPVGGGITGSQSAIRLQRMHLGVTMGRRDAAVIASFTFANTLAHDVVHQLIGFPDLAAAYKRLGTRAAGKLTGAGGLPRPVESDLALVDGQREPLVPRLGWVVPAAGGAWHVGDSGVPMAWRAVPVAIAPNRSVTVVRRYHVPLGQDPLGLSFFRYVTCTAGIWHGHVDRMELEVSLQDGLTTKDIVWPHERVPPEWGAGVFPASSGTRPERDAWTMPDATHLSLAWSDANPGADPRQGCIAIYAITDRPGGPS